MFATTLYYASPGLDPWVQAMVVVASAVALSLFIGDLRRVPTSRLIVIAVLVLVLSSAVVWAQPVYELPCEERPFWWIDPRCWFN